MLASQCRARFGQLSPKARQRFAESVEMTSPSAGAPAYATRTQEMVSVSAAPSAIATTLPSCVNFAVRGVRHPRRTLDTFIGASRSRRSASTSRATRNSIVAATATCLPVSGSVIS